MFFVWSHSEAEDAASYIAGTRSGYDFTSVATVLTNASMLVSPTQGREGRSRPASGSLSRYYLHLDRSLQVLHGTVNRI